MQKAPIALFLPALSNFKSKVLHFLLILGGQISKVLPCILLVHLYNRALLIKWYTNWLGYKERFSQKQAFCASVFENSCM